ncbi:hypothetical protein A5747_13290 [Mycobacterium sp. IS-836]|uniref:LtfC-like domain-containing protein n=1 Tax=Mycobacterium sp. IS-836 TaxID=1834160 RepID=UPI00096FCB0D|nr:hypothetical protein [Mycobacterium sp. IS-836]OMC55362.1 hypothetical protein A5747_13290 [Mycobacterium sp. IS-836]
MIGINPKMDTLVLTKGMGFQATFHDDTDWPAGAQAKLTFYDSVGLVIATLTAVPDGKDFVFNEPAANVDDIPHGAAFEFTVKFAGYDPIALSYGTAIRKEPRFPDAPPTDISDTALLFQDDFQRTDVGPRWIRINGTLKLLPNAGDLNNKSLVALPNPAATLFYAPLNGDDVTISCKVFGSSGTPNAAEQNGIVLCSDSGMTSYIGVTFEMSPTAGNNRWHIVKGTGPTAYTNVQTVTRNTTTNENVTVVYNSLTDTVLVYRNGDFTTPVMSASGIAVQHGLGYRYTGFNFIPNNPFTGPGFSYWRAQDGVLVGTH